MRHKLLIIIICCMCLPSITYSQDNIPTRNVELVDDGVIVTYHFNGAIYQQDPLYTDAKFWKIPGFGLNFIAGEPAFPFRWDSFAIPDGTNAEIELLDCQYVDTLFTLSPARPIIMESSTLSLTKDMVTPIQTGNYYFPKIIISTSPVQNYRNQRLIKVAVMPIQYNKSSHTIRNYTDIKYKINFVSLNNTKVSGLVCKNSGNLSKINYTDHFLENTTLNYRSILDTTISRGNKSNSLNAIIDNRYYLIITTSQYLNYVQRFANWKRIKGQRVIVESRNQWENTDSVKNAIIRHYHDTHDSLNYVLLVGNINDIPSYIRYFQTPENNVHPTDYYYGCITDSIKPDLVRGRLLVSSVNDVETIVDKIINYEKNPPSDSLFYKKGLTCTYFQDKKGDVHDGIEDRRFSLTTEEIRNYLISKNYNIQRIYMTHNYIYPLRWNEDRYSFGDTIPLALQKPTFAWNGNYYDISNGINTGAFFVFYRGHGGAESWEHPTFGINQLTLLNNKNKTPVFFNITCNTGMFNNQTGETLYPCFAEKILTKKNGGGVSVFAASCSSYSGYNDILAERMFDAIWPGSELRIQMLYDSDTISAIQYPEYEIGKIMDLGLDYMEEVGMPYTYHNHPNPHINEDYIIYQREIFHCFGDPSMMIYTQKPQHFQHPIITCRDGKIIVQTIEDDVRISLYTPSSNNVDSYIGNYVEYSTTADSVIICLDKHNYIPDIRTYYKNYYIQNETISEQHSYYGQSIYIGNHVTSEKPAGDVIIQNADVTIEGENIYLMPGTTIINSDVNINTTQ